MRKFLFNYRLMRTYENSKPRAIFKAILLICGKKAILSPRYWLVQGKNPKHTRIPYLDKKSIQDFSIISYKAQKS